MPPITLHLCNNVNCNDFILALNVNKLDIAFLLTLLQVVHALLELYLFFVMIIN